MDYKIVRLTDRPELKEQAARWFHEKWGIPLEAYMESMEECLEEKGPVPQWYMALDGERIIGGMGVIENDFHDRKDLAPNVCCIHRGGLAGPGRCRLAASVRVRGHEGKGDRSSVSDHRSYFFL